MKKKRSLTKMLWIIMAVSALALAVVIGLSIATDAIMSREDSTVIVVDQPFESVELITLKADITWHETNGQSTIEASAKAWREQPFAVGDLIDLHVDNGVLTIEGKGFARDFMGIFPQPYELKLTISAPQEVIDKMGGLS